MRRLRRAEIAGQRVILFKPLIDARYDADDVTSHAGVRMAAVPVEGSAALVARARGCEVVGIDEAQFFESRIVDAALALADAGVRVIAAGLDQDFRRLPFAPMPELLARAELVDKLQAVRHRCGGSRRRRSGWSTVVPPRSGPDGRRRRARHVRGPLPRLPRAGCGRADTRGVGAARSVAGFTCGVWLQPDT